VKLPVLYEDLLSLQEKNTVPLEVIIRGLRAQMTVQFDQPKEEQESQKKYYASYYLYFLYESVKTLLQQKEHEKISSVFSEITEFQAKNPDLVPKNDYRYAFYLALFEKQRGLLGSAELRLRTIVAENSENPYYRFELAKLLEERNDYDNSLEMYDKILSDDPRFIPAWFSTGDIFLKNGDYTEAEKRYLSCISISKAFVPPYARLGVLYNEQQFYGKALRVFEKGLSIAPDDAEMHYNYSFSLQRTGKFLSALNHLKTTLELLPDEITVLNEIGVLSRKLGFFHDSVEFFERALQKEPQNPAVLWNLLWSSLFVSKNLFFFYLDRAESALLGTRFELERFRPLKDIKSPPEALNFANFCATLLASYEEIPEELETRVSDACEGKTVTTEFTTEENLSLIDWFSDLVENFVEYPIELLRASTMFNVVITRSTRWWAFTFTFIELLLYTPAFDEYYEKSLEALFLTAQEYDLRFANQLAGIDRDSFVDWNELVENRFSFRTLFDVIRWLINLLWIDPAPEEVNILGSEEALFRLVRLILKSYRK
jgi:tetratricopeptide (TPR) repeat protein